MYVSVMTGKGPNVTSVLWLSRTAGHGKFFVTVRLPREGVLYVRRRAESKNSSKNSLETRFPNRQDDLTAKQSPQKIGKAPLSMCIISFRFCGLTCKVLFEKLENTTCSLSPVFSRWYFPHLCHSKPRQGSLTPSQGPYNSFSILDGFTNYEAGARHFRASPFISPLLWASYIPKRFRVWLFCMLISLTRSKTLGTLTKQRRQRQRERHQTKGLMSWAMVAHVHYNSWYISWLSSAKQRVITKFCLFSRTGTTAANISHFNSEFNAGITHLAWVSSKRDSCTQQTYIWYFYWTLASSLSLFKVPIDCRLCNLGPRLPRFGLRFIYNTDSKM